MAALKAEGFVASKFDHCLLYKEGIIIAVFVDDLAVAHKDADAVDKLIASADLP